MKNIFFYDTPVGRLMIAEENGRITCIEKDRQDHDGKINETSVIKEAKKQLEEYFLGKRREFDIPLCPKGTEFQKKVWKALCDIPYGETRSYKEIAAAAGNEKACRAVGMANNRNPISIVIPCHRVIGADGKLVGYGGGLPMKRYLLDLEKQSK